VGKVEQLKREPLRYALIAQCNLLRALYAFQSVLETTKQLVYAIHITGFVGAVFS